MIHEFIESAIFTHDMSFKEFIRKKRRLLGLNQTDFSKLLGIDRGTVSAWEIGITSPPIDKAAEIVKQLGGEIRIMNRKNIYYNEVDNELGFNPWQE